MALHEGSGASTASSSAPAAASPATAAATAAVGAPAPGAASAASAATTAGATATAGPAAPQADGDDVHGGSEVRNREGMLARGCEHCLLLRRLCSSAVSEHHRRDQSANQCCYAYAGP
ncbi:hypothetical protein [Streptomyces spiramyceticus]|uniref:hypothetical protein n=1 Tax=Streptomyces spiramyceticus TaxID=299717 RepID=UPI00237BEA12|nr:hypothetical protein [Streptomyces spiramyceticus]